MKNNTIYIRTLKHSDHTVFCVSDGQKSYYDAQFNRRIPYSSGQQVKRSILDSLSDALNMVPSPTSFLFDVTKQKELKEGEVYGTCDPSYPDQLLGGWMKATKTTNDKKATKTTKDTDDEEAKKILKRRSPLSISAMRALHPLLAYLSGEKASFDRSDRPNNQVIVRDENGKELSNDEIALLFESKNRSPNRKWLKEQSRASGLFVVDIAIDLRRLFTVSLNDLEPEMSTETITKLKAEGWVESKNVFGECLVLPKELREEWAKALAHAIVNWKITSNQSRTFSLMDTLAIAIGDNANLIAGSIRAKLSDEDSNKAQPIIDESLKNVDTFITLQAGGYIQTKGEKADALEQAEQKLVDLMLAFDYEHQI